MGDVLDAVVVELLADADVAALVGTRVFYASLPTPEVSAMPRKCVVVGSSGRVPMGTDNSYVDLARPRFDVKCYGEDQYEAKKVQVAVDAYMKALRPHNVALDDGDVRLHNATVSGGPTNMVEQIGDWPFVWAAYGVAAAYLFASGAMFSSMFSEMFA